MADAEQRIHRRDDARLRAGLPAIGLRPALEAIDAFIDQPFAQRRVVGPAVDVGADALEVDVGIAALGHPGEVGVNALPRLVHLREQAFGFDRVGRRDQLDRVIEQHARFGLDRDMDHDEPVLVRPAEEVLHHADVFEVDRTRLVEPGPVIEHIGGIGQQRRLAEPVRQGDDRTGEIGGQVHRRLGLAPYVGLHQEAVVHHCRADIFLGGLECPILEARITELIEPVAHAAGGEEVGQVVRRLLHPGELGRQGDCVDFIMRKEAALARQAVIGKLHGRTLARARVGPPGHRPSGIN